MLGVGDDLGQLGLLGLHPDREVLVVGPHRMRHRHQGRALLGEGVLHGPDLVANADGGGFQARDLTRQVFAGQARGVAGVSGGGGQVGGARRQRRFGFADLDLGEV